ncbi:hypothetical protein HHK36_025779 [Tetracentron sinense]|uniref:Trafficking protein particle complex subunit 2 n=1 Tax=Tetracentron sinense TaxID=13715 RepID=A0A834YI34_TETSI|nr:hypothetical protein HHK36_025779 [Tetracentron sinense]
MASTACFIIVSRNDIPIYEAEVGSAVKKEDAAHQHQFILHAALDIVQDLAWTTSAMFLKAVDRFNDLVVSVYVTAGHILHIFKLFYTLTFLLFSQRGQSHKSTYKRSSFFVSLTAHIIHTRLMLLHDSRNDDGIKSFFQEVHELYIKVYYCILSTVLHLDAYLILLNPLYLPGSRITSSHFDTKVRALARKYL